MFELKKKPVWGRRPYWRHEDTLEWLFQSGAISEERRENLSRRLASAWQQDNRSGFARVASEIESIVHRVDRQAREARQREREERERQK